ncbi:N-acetyl-anhydromuranmyl-L-alanine amidase [Chlamydia abortus]|jgi:N-acetyl-anhydromuramyl-L-alanine amidase AmpD|uniref:N-acetylmuramoyl-L-alanine amidase n=1 Tax=Paenibacillus residui TaxID=629724 RepID=A0ABW3DBA0_9BACL|nr:MULTISPECIES: N-acetylmuramoyl-L-alanine amidase [Paenibacillaceae]SHE10525.1 N-acetyl-anhydromuranmyl-L-alanine amidase [Chlamydia abortus]
MDIRWVGNEHTNSSSRQGYVPFVIVNHISAGTMASMDYWFTDPGNRVSSAHFGVSKTGTIHQYVAIERMAWANGLSSDQMSWATAPIVRQMKVNPNLYTVSIEHEGMDGALTEAQFQASVWLHRYIQQYILDKWGKDFPLDSEHVIGHFQINPVNKPNCPGPQFPWKRLYSALTPSEGGTDPMANLTDRIAALEMETKQLEQRLKQLEDYFQMDAIPEWARASVDKAVQSGLIDTPLNGSYDFYRLLVILDRKGLL